MTGELPLEPNVRFVRNAAGLAIAYSALGSGSPELLWVPNFTSHVDALWIFDLAKPFLGGLSRIGRILQFDQPGTGASDRVAPDALPTMEQWMDDVRVVMDAEGVEKATLIAEDSGGPVALLFAATHPERVRSVVVINSYARMERAPGYPWGFPPELRPKALKRWAEIWGTGRQLEMTAPAYAADPAMLRKWAIIERMSASPAMAAALFRMISAIDVRDVLPAVRVPVLVMHHRADPWIRVEHGRYLAEHIPGAQYVELPGDAHYAYALGNVTNVMEHIAEFVTGVPRIVEDAERVLTTLLFTDIVDSTLRAVEMGDKAWRELLDRHDAIVKELVARYRGRIVKSTGDGSLVMFDGPARAVRCAGDIRAAMRTLGVVVRSGLHTGEVELRGDDIGGVAVHVAARVEALAGPDEVLVSQTVKDLTIGSKIEYDERGEHELKGMPGRWRVYAAREPR
jgi:class 3 adenylate cyclase